MNKLKKVEKKIGVALDELSHYKCNGCAEYKYGACSFGGDCDWEHKAKALKIEYSRAKSSHEDDLYRTGYNACLNDTLKNKTCDTDREVKTISDEIKDDVKNAIYDVLIGHEKAGNLVIGETHEQ